MNLVTAGLCIVFIGLLELQLGENKKIYIVTVPDDISLYLPPHLIEAGRKFKQAVTGASHNFNFKSVFKAADGCKVCEEVVEGIISLRKSNATRETMIDYLNRLCGTYTTWGEVGCVGRINNEVDTYLYIIDNKDDLKAARFCAIHFQDYECEDPNADDWSISIPPYPSKDLNKTQIAVLREDETKTMKIVQITDVHIDPLYVPESNAKCETPLCCESGTPAKTEDAAGYWGDYRSCDMPWHTMDSMLDTINKNDNEIDYVYFTGDIVPHNNWITSVKSNSEVISQFFALLDKNFPNQIVYPIFGNHEPHPTDFYSPESVDRNANVSTQWLFDLAAEDWAKWLPNDTLTTLKKGGYYTVLVKPGFRLIALNSNVCYTANLWLVYENKDTYDQLQWLVEILTEAEKNGEKVHILSHIPSGDIGSSCTKVWTREFKKIILRFADTIAAQFNGHTHYDEFKVYFNDSAQTEVKTVAYNGASFTTIWGSNSNYRTYDVDSDNLTVTDYTEYTFNLTAANLNVNSTPEWYKLYSFKEAYGLPDLTLKSLGDLYQKMTSNNYDNELVDKYVRYRYRDSDVFNNEGCDSNCKKQLVCVISAGDTNETLHC